MTQDTAETEPSRLGGRATLPITQTQSGVRADIQAIDRMALVGLLDLIGSWMQSSSARWTANDLIENVGVVPRHAWIVDRWLSDLAHHGLIVGDETGWSCAYRPSRKQLRTVRDDMMHAASRLGYGSIYVRTLLESARRSAELLRDEITIQSLFFPNGTTDFARDIYETNTISQYLNQAAAEAIGTLGPKPVRALEVGAGIGATTAAIAESDLPICHYAYTDLSSWFLELGKHRFADKLPLSTHLLNIDENFTDQLAGTDAPGEFDVVLAANVAHNAPDVSALLSRVGSVLRPGGRLLLIELVQEHPQILITMIYALSLPESFADPSILDTSSGIRRNDERRGSYRTLLTDAEWRNHLTAAGFNVQNVLPDPEHPLYPTSQRLFVAERQG